MSTDTTGGPDALIASITLPGRPTTGPRRPVPKIASTINSARANVSAAHTQSGSPRTSPISSPRSDARIQFVLASPFNSSPLPKRYTQTLAPACLASRATTKPSPPLLPFPQTIASVLPRRSPRTRRRAAKTPLPARSMRSSPGIPSRSMVQRSMFPICAPVTSFIPHISSGSPQPLWRTCLYARG